MISYPTGLLSLYSTVLPVLADVSLLNRTKKKSLLYHLQGRYYTGYSFVMEHPGLSTLAIKHEELRLKFAGSLVVSEFRDWLPGRTQGSITDRVTHKPNCLEAILYLYCANCYNTDLSLKQLWKKKWLNKIFNYCTNGFDSVATSHIKWIKYNIVSK